MGCGCGKRATGGASWVAPPDVAAGADVLRSAFLAKWGGTSGCVDVIVVYPSAGAPVAFPLVDYPDRAAALDAALDAWVALGGGGRVVDVCQTSPA